MELSPASAASEAFRAAEIIRIAAQKPKKEDYSDYEVFRREYKSSSGGQLGVVSLIVPPRSDAADSTCCVGQVAWHSFVRSLPAPAKRMAGLTLATLAHRGPPKIRTVGRCK